MIRCVSCGEEYDNDEIIYTCEKCGSVLELVSDFDVSKDIFDGRKDTLWKFKECIPVDESKIVSLNEGGTPFCKCDKLGDELGINLYVKVEGSNPTGSFKDRGMTVGMTKAMELGVHTVGCASTGNTSASLAAYAARAGLRCIVFLPSGKVALGKLAQAMFHGAEVMSINGNFDEALEAMTALALEKHLYLLNSINPYRLEGQKTIGYEILRDLGWQSPDRIILPVGNAGNISAIWKGVKEFYEAGFVDSVPMMTGIQAEGACPVTNAFKKHADRVVPVENPDHIQSASATRWGRYDISGDAVLKGGEYKTIHAGFDPAAADADPNVITPVDALKELEKEGVFGSLHPYFYTTVGTGTTQAEAERMAKEIIPYLKEDGVDGVIMVST